MTYPTERQMDRWFREGQRIAERLTTGTEMTRMTRWLVSHPVSRRVLVRNAGCLQRWPRLHDWLLDRLYPDDAMVSIGGEW